MANGVPFTWGIRELGTITSLSKISKQKWGACLNPFSAGAYVPEEFGWVEQHISARGNVLYRGAQGSGYPFSLPIPWGPVPSR